MVQSRNLRADRVGHEREQLVLVLHMVVQGGCLDSELLGEAAHREPVEAVLIQQFEGSSNDRVSGDLRTGSPSLGPRCEPMERLRVFLALSRHG